MGKSAKQLTEINKNIRAGINQWADIALMADADDWAKDMQYYPSDIMNASLIFMHIAMNVGIKEGRINGENAAEYGERFRQLITDMTGYDPQEIINY